MSNIASLSRRFLLKWAQDSEAEKLLKKHLGPTENFEHGLFEELVGRNIIPILSSKHKSILGSGAYSIVYEVSYKGRLGVAKITKSKQDYDIILKLNNLKRKLGEDAKFLPQIFDNFIIEKYDDSYYIMIIEKLLPLDSYLKNKLFPSPYKNNGNFQSAKNTIDLTETIVKINDSIKLSSDIPNEILTPILEELDSIIRKTVLSSNDASSFRSQITNNLKSLNKYYSNVEDLFVKDNLRYILNGLPNKIIDAIGHEQYFPTYGTGRRETDEDMSHFISMPESKKFIAFLMKLKNQFSIAWGDLHANNIMMRPGTKDLVLSDSGLFEGKGLD